MKLVLASSSPRRIELMGWLDYPFEVFTAGVDERQVGRRLKHLDPAEIASKLARAKMEAAARVRSHDTIVSADTVVAVDGQVLGKPDDEADALSMLRRIQGRSHDVITAVQLRSRGQDFSGCLRTRVVMSGRSETWLREYVASGEPMDKAGGYAVQGRGGRLVEAVEGCYLTVVGFPLCAVAALLAKAALLPTDDPVGLCDRVGKVIRKSQFDHGVTYEVSDHPSLASLHQSGCW